MRPPMFLHGVEDVRQLDADEDEDHAVEQVDDEIPHGLNLQADAGVEDLGRIPADVEAGANDREDAGDMEKAVGQQVADVGVIMETVTKICAPSSRRRRRSQSTHFPMTRPTATPPTPI